MLSVHMVQAMIIMVGRSRHLPLCNWPVVQWTMLGAMVPLQEYGGAASVLVLESAAKASMLGTTSNYRQSQTFTKCAWIMVP
ncbi:hypothetical protein LAZ67_1001798 [Cordylochernes scorpioides]|uniref:Uncharacterized protein n=1 Tax=Cordylochernes scorpioides TaxID=51811 RepID=A0ABY6JVV6_9ARAC|nr:hypothetical protein LAZ67_1001798 [Cordylochernes scorpioides]